MPDTQEREISTREAATQGLINAQGPVQTIRQMTDQMIAQKEADLRHKPIEREDGHSWVVRANPNGVVCTRCGSVVAQPKGGVVPPTPDWGCKGRKGD